MDKQKVIIATTVIIVLIFGSIPGLGKIFGQFTGWYIPMQPPLGEYWRDLIVGIAGTLGGVITGYLIVKWTKRLIKAQYSHLKNSFIILIITFLACDVASIMGMTIIEVMGGLFGWHRTPGSPELLETIGYFLLMLVFNAPNSLIPSLINGLFSFFYLKLKK